MTYPTPLCPSEQKLYLIKSFNEEECYRLFRFRKEYLRKLFFGLGVYNNLPEWIVIDERAGNVYHREMMMLLMLYRYAQGGTFYLMCLDGWGDESVSCRAFNFASEFIYDTMGHLVRNDLRRDSARFPEYNNAIKLRLRKAYPLPRELPRDAENIALIIDGTRRDIATPGDEEVEDSTYSGYTGSHCLGYLALINVTGLCPFVAGPLPGRDPDHVFVRDIRLNETLRLAQEGNIDQFIAYGDRLFFDEQYIHAAPRSDRFYQVPRNLAREHNMLRCIRCIIEMYFQCIVNLFNFVDWKPAQKVMQCAVGRHFINIVLLTNCYNILMGNSIALMFEVAPPTLEEYLNFRLDDIMDDDDTD